MSKPWPHDTLEKLRDAGYSFADSSLCREPECGRMIYWFFTPNKKRMPFEMVTVVVTAAKDMSAAALESRAIGENVPHYLPHFATCPAAKRFSRSGGHIR